ncbi:MAG: hypothetical protein L6R38_006053 [Xanthoria sp. 2 TBL-2021]|nr:MAG: hypothetical protein L6R38_006053 [Xanthoria sp. 2 TBL-2021]
MERSNTTAQSALYGRPPNTDNDYWIVKALLFEMKIADADPVQGLPFEHFPPLSDENRSGSIIAAVTISIFFIVAVTATRLVARKTIRTSSLGWDDALISVAALGTVGGTIHYITAGFTKFAIIFFNVRLTGSTSRIWIWVHRTCFVVVLAWLLTALFGIAMSCKPNAAVANYIAAGKAGPHLKCNSNNPGIGLSLQILHALLDWILLAVPIIILVRLKMAWQKKVQCIFPLAIGTSSAVGASKRIYDHYHPHPDITYYFASQLPWTIVDIVCAICVTSLPAINNLLIHHLPRHLSQYWSGGDPGSSPTSGGSQYPSHGIASRDLNNGRNASGAGNSVDETKQIMVQRDIDLESMRTVVEDNPDPGYLELNELNNRHRRGNGTFINS